MLKLLIIPLALITTACGSSNPMEEQIDGWRNTVASQVKNKTPLVEAAKQLKSRQAPLPTEGKKFVTWTVDAFDDEKRHCSIKVRYAINQESRIAGGHVESACIYKPPA